MRLTIMNTMLPARIRTVGKLKTIYFELFINMITLVGR